MLLYLVRHGQALPQEQHPQCPLSASGRAQIVALGQVLHEKAVQPHFIWHSSKARAQETAQILAQALNLETAVRERPHLSPMDPLEPMLQTLARLDEDLLLVGHLPYLANLATQLADTKPVFHTGTCLCLQRGDTPNWVEQWCLNPALPNEPSN